MNLQLSISIDGIPLFYSSSEQLWPILGSLENSDIFIIALFYGKHKPDNVEEYLYDFIQEWNELAVDGIFYQDKHFNLIIKYFLCDAPARSFLKCIINHTGCSSCERCCIHGTYEGRIVFNEEIEYALCEDCSFPTYKLRGPPKRSIISISQHCGNKLDINICFRLYASCLFRGSLAYFKLSEKTTRW